MALNNLGADLEALRNTRPNTFKEWLAWADAEDVQLVMDAINDTRIPIAQLVRTLQKHGVPISKDTIGAYRESAQ